AAPPRRKRRWSWGVRTRSEPIPTPFWGSRAWYALPSKPHRQDRHAREGKEKPHRQVRGGFQVKIFEPTPRERREDSAKYGSGRRRRVNGHSADHVCNVNSLSLPERSPLPWLGVVLANLGVNLYHFRRGFRGQAFLGLPLRPRRPLR